MTPCRRLSCRQAPHLAYWDSKDETLVNARGMQVSHTMSALLSTSAGARHTLTLGEATSRPPWSAEQGIRAVALTALTAE